METTNLTVEGEAFVRRYDGLCRKMAGKAARFIPLMEYDDVLQEARLALAQSAQRWRPEGGASRVTYAYVYIRNRLRNLYRTQERQLAPVLFGDELEYVASECGIDRRLREWQAASICSQLLGMLTPREQEIVARYWGVLGHDRQSFREIGKQIGLTGNRVAQIHHAAFRRLQVYAEAYREEWEEGNSDAGAY